MVTYRADGADTELGPYRVEKVERTTEVSLLGVETYITLSHQADLSAMKTPGVPQLRREMGNRIALSQASCYSKMERSVTRKSEILLTRGVFSEPFTWTPASEPRERGGPFYLYGV